MILNRSNPNGLVFRIREAEGDNNKTIIFRGNKAIVVDVKLEVISQCWYNWQMRGQLIQEAFPMLSADDREFLISGMLGLEFDKLMKNIQD
jgi:hypothetical protein